MKIETT